MGHLVLTALSKYLPVVLAPLEHLLPVQTVKLVLILTMLLPASPAAQPFLIVPTAPAEQPVPTVLLAIQHMVVHASFVTWQSA